MMTFCGRVTIHERILEFGKANSLAKIKRSFRDIARALCSLNFSIHACVLTYAVVS
jgi:hypothetical protein